ncbi:hepatitis A virus cellular receptor 1 isoform X1 [Sciurus carolinensis]|uniref:hepatitis A virus cellular receptor 1 isoform X1 n=1 Tax=Sciurus carolinensis TaxID=30640 RepID=UPI001FB29FEF|nr:hepatitis A virus cellular receptor 1 isoform X1 [Sciurus carolinensis]
MYPEVVVLSLILLLTGAVVSYTEVSGVVGQSVTLPCSYSVDNGAVTSMCWGRGACPISKCSDEIVWTDGSQVTFRKHMRYKLEGNLLEGDVSLTIEDAAKTDSGLYCCRIEHRGWFNDMKVTLSLEIKPARDTSVPMTPRAYTSAPPTPARTQNHKTVTTSPSTTQASETQTMTLQETESSCSPLYPCPTDGNGTMTQSSDGLWHNNQTQVFPARSPGMTNAGLYIGIAIFTLVLLLAVSIVIIIKKYFFFRKKMQPLSMVSLTGPQIGTLQSEADVRARAEDNVYIIEDNFYVME